jgi:hypothetical protein
MALYLEPGAGTPGATVVAPADLQLRRRLEASVVLVGSAAAASPDVRTELDEDIAGLDLEPISYLAVLNERWDLAKVDAMELEYRCWLQCVRDFPQEVIVPSFDCDLYWHCHILYLGLYLEQTTRLFGAPLLHWPFSGLLGEADAALQRERFVKSRRIIGDLVERVAHTRSINVQPE